MTKLNKILDRMEEYLAVSTMLISSLLVFTQVVLRYLFHETLYWSEEVARYLVIWGVFIGSSIAVREKGHATVDAIVVLLPTKFKRLFFIFANLAGIVFCLVLIWSGILVVSSVISYGNVTPSLGISMAVPYLAVPVGGAMMLYRFLQLLLKGIRGEHLVDHLSEPLEEGGTEK